MWNIVLVLVGFAVICGLISLFLQVIWPLIVELGLEWIKEKYGKEAAEDFGCLVVVLFLIGLAVLAKIFIFK